MALVVQLPKSKGHDDEPEMGPNETALVETLRSLGEATAADAALWQMLRSLARAVDTAPAKAAIWKEYREALTHFLKETDDADDSLEKATEALRSASEVGHSKK